VNNAMEPRGDSSYSDTTNQRRKEVLFYALAVIFTSTLVVACFPLLHITNNWAGNALMFIPGLMALALRLRYRDGFRSVGWGTGPLIYWLWAILLPVIALLMSLPISIRLGYAALAPASTAIGRLALNPTRILENVLLYTAISIPFAFAEEFGWRGYAQGKLVRSFGLVNGLLLLGIIWGFWHTPIYYFMGTYPNHSILGPFVMTPIDNILAVVPMGWLYIRSRNIWVPTLTHAFADVLWGFSGLIFPATQEVRSWALLQAAQLTVSIILLIDLKSRPAEASGASSSFLPVTP
jgi:membrane protease YdiL (CAAX protease family)